MAERAGAGRHRGVLYNRTPRAGPRRWPSELGAARGADPGRGRGGRGRRASRWSPTTPPSTPLRRSGRPPRRRAAGLGARRHEHRRRPTRSGRSRRRSRARGAGLLDAPVSGSVALAEAGELTIMVGGDAADLERARPVLDPLARAIFHLGPLGTGAAMKLAVNTLIFGLNGRSSEGLVLAERSRHRPGARLRRARLERRRRPVRGLQAGGLRRPRRDAGRFSLDLAEKDLRLIRELAEASGTACRRRPSTSTIDPRGATAAAATRDFATASPATCAASARGAQERTPS